ncbi:peptide ABC transporter permease [Hypericibacter terrae]|uniref:Peptide ABC transporter permease n=1 Tax=Hypericibacter terrae TaxID=2602015 RepID=A0A5J6MHQ4_9PROT|nr:ABC transporter permease [Hypericibacter terrae]QEX17048.1 peptide ABC transporter permease [Hypericibacter terrae]
MVAFFAKRLGYLVLTMLVVSFAIYMISEFTPGDVARKVLGPFATQHQVELLTEQMGLNRPVFIRYFEWVGQILTGDLGYSTVYKTEVNNIIWNRLAHTLVLAGIAFAVIVPASILLGVTAGMRESSRLDRSISLFSIVTTSVPEFASGVFLTSIFAIWIGILPGTSTLDKGGGWSIASQLVLPVAVMVFYDLGYVVRMVRASMIEVMTRPYIRTAVLKGMKFRDVIMKHALRNAMIAPFTVILLQINYLVTGVVVVEAVFAYPGFGRMMLEAALSQDIAVIEAGALFSVLVAVVTQIVGDFGYMLLNPRIRFS